MSSKTQTSKTLANSVSMSDVQTLTRYSKLLATRDNETTLTRYASREMRSVIAHFAKRDVLKTLKCNERTLRDYATKRKSNSDISREMKNALSEHSKLCAQRAGVEHNKLGSRVLATCALAIMHAKRNDAKSKSAKRNKRESVENVDNA